MSIISLLLSPALAMTPEQVLKTAWADKTYVAHESLQETKSINPFRNVEAFYSQEDDGATEKEVGLKFNLKSYSEWKSGRASLEGSRALQESSLAWALRDRYSFILGWEIGQQKLKVLNELIEALEKNLQAQNLAMRTTLNGNKNFLSAKEELLRLKRTEGLLKEEREILKRKLERWFSVSEKQELDRFDLLEAEDLEALLKSAAAPSQTLSGRLVKAEILQLDQELQMVKGKENQWFKSFDISQTEKKNEYVYQFGVSLQLPPLGSDVSARQKQNELVLKMALKQRDLENQKDQLPLLRFQILNSLEIYKLAKAHHELTQRSKSLDPLANLQTKINRYKEQLDLLNQRQAILTLYLDYLLESDTLSKEPGINHLSRGKKAIL